MNVGRLIASLAIVLLMVGVSHAAPQRYTDVTKISRNDGNTNNPFAVTCSSFAWTMVGSSMTTTNTPSIRRRAMTIQTLGTVTYSVCLSSTNTTANTCSDSRPGYELGAAWGSVSIYDEATWYCQTRTGGSTVVKGAEHYDNRDMVR